MLNLTPDQAPDGATDVADRPRLVELMTFKTPPCAGEIATRAEVIAVMAARTGEQAAVVGGPLFLVAPLCEALLRRGVRPGFLHQPSGTWLQVVPADIRP